MKTLAWLCLALLWAAGTASAQVSSPDLLTSPFDDSRTPSGVSATLLQPRPEALPPPGVLWEGRDELTVHTNKKSAGLLDDVHANGFLAALRTALGTSPSAPQLVLCARNLDTGITDNEGGKAFHLTGRFRQPEVRLLWPLRRRGLAYAAYRETNYDAGGTTQFYNGIFTIFPQTPQFRYEGRERLAVAGMRLPVSSAWTVETVIGRIAEPSRLLLHQDGVATQVSLPFNDGGTTALLAVRRRLSPSSCLLGYFGGEHLRGTGTVAREAGLSIGSADTTHREDGSGLGWQRTFGERRVFTVFAEMSRDRWQTHGYVASPRTLQPGAAFASDLFYSARYDLRKEAMGIRWSQTASRHQEFRGTAQLINLSVYGAADYAVRDFGLLKTGRTTYVENDLRALLLRGSYGIPWKQFRFGLEASQLVPLGSGSGNSSGSSPDNGGGGGADPRTTTGGWSLSLRVERLF